MSRVFHIDQRTEIKTLIRSAERHKNTKIIVMIWVGGLHIVSRTTDIQMVKLSSKKLLGQADLLGFKYSVNMNRSRVLKQLAIA